MSIRRAVAIEQAEWHIAPTPEWVETREPDWDFAPAEGHAVAFLLLDEQHDVATQARASRTLRRLLTPAAVQALSQVEVDFDPAAHRLLIHEMAVWRRAADGRWEKRSSARRESFLVRQREQQLEQQILSGRVSVVALLEDVRLDDAIEVAWTLEAIDPLPGLRFAAYFGFVWSVPVARVFFTLQLSPEHPVRWQMHAPDGVAVPELDAEPERVTWRVEHPPIFAPEPNVPAGVWPFAVLDVSGWETWPQVARFIAELWSDALTEGAESVAAEAARVGADGAGPEAVRAAIRFVQEEIRYLAVDFGHGGILPNGAGSVLRRRFGDCKDKAVLLTAMLRARGIEAWPLLVGADWRGAVARVQPSTAAFSHAIVTLRLRGQRYFVDPTLVGQGGDLERLIAPPFGCGLEVRTDAEGLLALPELPAAELSLTEIFDLDHEQRDGAVEQVLHASAWLADDIRAALVHEGRAAFLKARMEALQAHFPALREGRVSPAVEDDVDANVIEVRARHELPTWGASGQKPPAMFSYGAHGLFLALEGVEGPVQRRQPWALRFPMKLRHRVLVRGDCVHKIRPELHRFDGPGFRYVCEVGVRPHEVTFDYCWETTQREVSADDWAEYRQQRSKALERTGANVGTVAGTRMPWGGIGVVLGVIVLLRLAMMLGEVGSPTRRPVTRPAVEQLQPERGLRRLAEAVRRRDHVKAQQLIEQARDRYSWNLDFQILRAEAALLAGDLGEARSAIASARSANASSIAPDLLKASLYETEGDLGAARKLVARTLLRAPDDPRALLHLARIAARTGDVEAARSALEKILARDPAHVDALLHYGLLLWREGARERADAIITGALRAQEVASPSLEAAVAQYYAATDRHAEALAPSRRAAELAPADPILSSRHAMALVRVGDEVGALEFARRMVQQFPRDPVAWGALAIVAATSEDSEGAESAFRSWLELAPGDADAYSNYGIYLGQRGRPAEARALLEEATRKFPGNGLVWLSYATVLDSLGETEAAVAARGRADALLTDEQRASILR